MVGVRTRPSLKASSYAMVESLLSNGTTAQPLLSSKLVREAFDLIRSKIHKTPLLTSTTLSTIASRPTESCFDDVIRVAPNIKLFFKCENLQRTGSFKFRGATHSLARLRDDDLRNGVVTNSSGNHAQALALAARDESRNRGFPIPVYAVMPSIAVISKIAAAKRYGAIVIYSKPTSEERELVTEQVHRDTGAAIIPSANDVNVILGQGTIALEILEQIKELGEERLDAMIVACGGGGMLAGLAIALRDTGIKVFGAEPCEGGADDAARGLREGRRIEAVNSLTIADGLRVPVGRLNWEVISRKEYVEGVYTVTEEQIKDAMKLIIERMKIVVEPSAAVPLAVVLYNEEFRKMISRRGKRWRIAVVFSGGNVTVDRISELLS